MPKPVPRADSCVMPVGTVMTSGSTRSSSCPSSLDQFSFGSVAENLALPIHLCVLRDHWADATQRCTEPSLGAQTPPLDALTQLIQRAHTIEELVTATAEAFRRADMGELVRNWSHSATNDFNAAVEAGAKVPQRRPGWTMLRFDTEDRGRLIELKGDLQTATHIVVMVPGMTNELSNVDRDFRDRSDALYNELLARAQPGEHIAVIMWLGYSNPQVLQLGAAMGSQMARDGAVTLNDDLRALRATGSLAEITVVAHSYGTILAGEAMDRGLPVDRLIVVGSPGMNAKDRASLGSPDVDLYASSVGEHPSAIPGVIRRLGTMFSLVNPAGAILTDVATGKDWAASTSRVGAHGTDPAEPGFGSTTFPSDGQGHSAYFAPRSLAIANLALISLGRRPVKDLDDTDPPKRPTVMHP
jgi:pimeloyl-ACP methyl ester carboxylesterase